MQTPFFAPNGAATRLINDLQGDIFLNALYGAIVSGIGYGLVYRARGTSGGSDILARILNHYRGVPMTQSYLIVDTVVILGAGFVFGWKAALYAMIALYVSGLVAETTLEGGGTVRTAMIVTSEAGGDLRACARGTGTRRHGPGRDRRVHGRGTSCFVLCHHTGRSGNAKSHCP